jgi:uncharacterized protein YndB with AHSA1/START domain
LEERTVDKPSFVYTIYIQTTPEHLWQALTDPAFTRRYWGATHDTDWKAGSPMVWHYGGVTIADPAQMVLEAEPYRHLSYSWQSITPEFAKTVGFSDEYFEKVAAEPRSKVTFEIEPVGAQVKLTVVHEGFEPGSQTLQSVTMGWPVILSNLKTLLETGEPMQASMDTTRQLRERREADAERRAEERQ